MTPEEYQAEIDSLKVKLEASQTGRANDLAQLRLEADQQLAKATAQLKQENSAKVEAVESDLKSKYESRFESAVQSLKADAEAAIGQLQSRHAQELEQLKTAVSEVQQRAAAASRAAGEATALANARFKLLFDLRSQVHQLDQIITTAIRE
jgi:hypothetical protein